MTFMRSTFLIFLLGALLSSPAVAQTAGSINGVVTDSSSAALPGVKVTATSPALISPQAAVVGATGAYRFENIPIGMYKLTFEAPGFVTMVRDQVEVQSNFALELNVALTRGSAQQAVTVSGQTTMVDQRNVTVQSQTKAATLSTLGAGRDIWTVMAVTPGMAIVGKVDVGGSTAGNMQVPASYGYGAAASGSIAGSWIQSSVSLDGVNTTEGRAAAGFYFDYGAMSELRSTTASNDAAMGVPGVQTTAVVKQGGNLTRGDVYMDYESPSFQGRNITPAQLHQGAGDGQRVQLYQDYDGGMGGPIVKNKLWYYFCLREERLGNSVTGFPADNPGNGPHVTTFLQNITEKFTYKLARKQTLTQFIQFNRKNQPYRNAASNYTQDAVFNQNLGAWAGKLQYDATFLSKLFVTLRFANFGYNQSTKPWRGPSGQVEPRRYEVQTTDSSGGFPAFRYDRRRYQYDGAGSYFIDRGLGAAHQLKFGFTWERENLDNEQYGPLGQMFLWYNSPGQPDFTTPYQVSLENGPAIAMDYMDHGGAYFTDQIRIRRRAALTVGARWDYYHNWEPNEQVRQDAIFRGFYYAGQPLPNGYSIPATNPDYRIAARDVLRHPVNISPRIGLALDLTGKGKTFLKVNWGRFFSNPSMDFGSYTVNGLQYEGRTTTGGSQTAVGGTPGTPTTGTAMTFKWNNPGNLPFNLNQLGTYVSGAPPVGVAVDPKIKLPMLDEGTAFIDEQLTKTISVRTGFVLRYLHHDWQMRDVARTYDLYSQPVQAYDPGRDGVRGTADDRGNVTVYDIPAGAPLPVSRYEMQTPDANHEQYMGYEFTVNKRMAKRFSLVASYSWNAVHLSYAGVPDNPLKAYNTRVNTSSMSSTLRGSYQAPWGIVISPAVRLMQGQPTDRTLNITGLHTGNFALIVDPFGTYRYDNVYVFDTRFEKRIKFKDHYELGLIFDAYNIFNNNSRVTYNVNTGTKTLALSHPGHSDDGQTFTYPVFGSPATIVGPRVTRIGVKFAF